ncbi:MAG TPA: hypothetical protein PLR76_15415, partial [Hyphomonas sp.]|nr:hypothetical protein [Hyphomonas sp.]
MDREFFKLELRGRNRRPRQQPVPQEPIRPPAAKKRRPPREGRPFGVFVFLPLAYCAPDAVVSSMRLPSALRPMSL